MLGPSSPPLPPTITPAPVADRVSADADASADASAGAPAASLLESAKGFKLQAAATMFSVDEEESAADDAPRDRGARASVVSRIFTIQPLLAGSLFEDAPAVPLERCAHTFHELHQWQPFLWFRQLGYFSYALLAFSAFMTITIVFFSICTNQWFHLLFTVPWAFFIVCELSFADKRAYLCRAVALGFFIPRRATRLYSQRKWHYLLCFFFPPCGRFCFRRSAAGAAPVVRHVVSVGQSLHHAHCRRQSRILQD